jgi:NitT/TauT family transport system permease protein
MKTLRLGRWLRATAVILSVFLTWEVVCRGFRIHDYVLPAPGAIAFSLVKHFPQLWPELLHTVQSAMLGFVLGSLLGIVFGVLIGRFRLAYDTLYPLLIGFSSIPKVAILPILVIWFGTGTIPAVLVAMLLCLFPVTVNVATGIATTEPELEDVLRVLGARDADILWHVALPRSLPHLFAALKVGVTVAFIGAITSETIASNSGIGNVMMVATANFDVPLLFAGLALISFTGIGLYVLFSLVEARLTSWAQRRPLP